MLFSSKPKNRKRRVRRKAKQKKDWDLESSPTPRARKKKKGEEEVHVLHAQIGALETFLAKKHEAEARTLQMKIDNILPPPDRSQYRRQVTAMSLAEKRRYHAERSRNGINFFFLFCLACVIGWWIIFCSL